MSLHPGERGVCPKHGEYDEYCDKCVDGQVIFPPPKVLGKVTAYRYCPYCGSELNPPISR